MKQIPHPKVNPYEQIRKLIRWKYYDYACSGTYFVTICTHDRNCFFGDIKDGILDPSRQGCVAKVVMELLPKISPNVEILTYVIMPDHLHILLWIHNDDADLKAFEQRNEEIIKSLTQRQKETLSSFIASYKSAVTRFCHSLSLEMKWQTSYFDRVVRNVREEEEIRKYIKENPGKWETD